MLKGTSGAIISQSVNVFIIYMSINFDNVIVIVIYKVNIAIMNRMNALRFLLHFTLGSANFLCAFVIIFDALQTQ